MSSRSGCAPNWRIKRDRLRRPLMLVDVVLRLVRNCRFDKLMHGMAPADFAGDEPRIAVLENDGNRKFLKMENGWRGCAVDGGIHGDVLYVRYGTADPLRNGWATERKFEDR